VPSSDVGCSIAPTHPVDICSRPFFHTRPVQPITMSSRAAGVESAGAAPGKGMSIHLIARVRHSRGSEGFATTYSCAGVGRAGSQLEQTSTMSRD